MTDKMLRLDKTQTYLHRLEDQKDDGGAAMHLTCAERWEAVWQISTIIWTLRGEDEAATRFSRHVTNIYRRGG